MHYVTSREEILGASGRTKEKVTFFIENASDLDNLPKADMIALTSIAFMPSTAQYWYLSGTTLNSTWSGPF